MKGCNLSHVLVLVFVSCFCHCEGCLEEERTTLLQIRESKSHPNGSLKHFQGWEGESCCQWTGVECNNSTCHVVRLSLVSETEEKQGIWHLNTTLLAQFKQLQVLQLTGNQIGGSNTLQGLCELKYLSILDLSDNLMDGDVPQCLGTMHSLQHLDLSRNRLQGTISPLIFSNLTMIKYISLSNNQLAGLFPFSMLANLSNLVSLNLSSNHLLEVETESPTWIPGFQLTYLNLKSCKLNAQSNRNIPSFISSQHTLGVLDLSNNSLIGAIPPWLLFNSTSSLSLGSNMLSGPFPLPHRNTTSPLTSLDISNNRVSGPLPANFFDLFPSLSNCDMSRNHLQGSLPTTSAWSLSSLDLSNNNFTGKIPQNFMKNSTSLQILRLSNNNLEGEMFPRDSLMPLLSCLELDGNRFTTPPNLRSSPSLVTLDIRRNYLVGNVSSWLEILATMVVLLIGGNHFEGPIPSQIICKMPKLRFLDLSASGVTGSIPSCMASVPSWKSERPLNEPFTRYTSPVDFNNKGQLLSYAGLPLQRMTVIDMSLNKLTGTIPLEMGNMAGLRSLNLSNNLLQGAIPTSFQGLKLIESLDLSHNKLSGTIPQEMTKLDFLGTFTVAFNNLSGEIPYQGRHFDTFNGSSYDGNPGLCGKPLERNCSSNIPSQPREREVEEGEDSSGILDSDPFFYSCVALSYCVGFWGMIAFLYFNESCRRKFFGTADAFRDWCFVKLHKIASYFGNH